MFEPMLDLLKETLAAHQGSKWDPIILVVDRSGQAFQRVSQWGSKIGFLQTRSRSTLEYTDLPITIIPVIAFSCLLEASRFPGVAPRVLCSSRLLQRHVLAFDLPTTTT